MRPSGVIAALAMCGALGCESAPDRTATQWGAIETCEVPGARDDVLRAASAVILDEGYFFIASDHEAGLVTGARVPGSQQDHYRRTGGMHESPMFDSVCLWVCESGASGSQVRVQFYDRGRHIASRERVLAFWNSVQKRMLKPGAPAAEHAAGVGRAERARESRKAAGA